jgi:hypothetical protein
VKSKPNSLLIHWCCSTVDKALVQQVLQTEVVGADEKLASPQVGAPVAHSLHQADELPLVGRKLQMPRANGWLKNATGPAPWCSTAPNPTPDASQLTMKSLSKSDICRTGPVVRARLSAWNASSASLSQEKASQRRRRVSGAAIRPKSRMNFL